MSESQTGTPLPPIATLADSAGDDSLRYGVRSSVAGIGQGTRNEVVLADDSVSTNHARLEYVEGGWRLTDLESKNGTYVDGVRLVPGATVSIADGAAVAFGAVRLTFHANAAIDPEVVGAAKPPVGRTTAHQKRSGFRMPIWVFILVILAIAVLVFLMVTLTGDPAVTEQLQGAAAASFRMVADLPIAA